MFLETSSLNNFYHGEENKILNHIQFDRIELWRVRDVLREYYLLKITHPLEYSDGILRIFSRNELWRGFNETESEKEKGNQREGGRKSWCLDSSLEKRDVTCDSKINPHKKLVFEMILEEKEIMPGHDISSTPFSHIQVVCDFWSVKKRNGFMRKELKEVTLEDTELSMKAREVHFLLIERERGKGRDFRKMKNRMYWNSPWGKERSWNTFQTLESLQPAILDPSTSRTRSSNASRWGSRWRGLFPIPVDWSIFNDSCCFAFFWQVQFILWIKDYMKWRNEVCK